MTNTMKRLWKVKNFIYSIRRVFSKMLCELGSRIDCTSTTRINSWAIHWVYLLSKYIKITNEIQKKVTEPYHSKAIWKINKKIFCIFKWYSVQLSGALYWLLTFHECQFLKWNWEFPRRGTATYLFFLDCSKSKTTLILSDT